MSVAPIRQLKNRHGFQPFEQDFTYTGNVQTLTIPKDGLYQLEVWGASGGNSGGNGGYSKGYKYFDKNTVLYIVCGEKGAKHDDVYITHQTYNGGGSSNSSYEFKGGSGGGATHIAKVTGELKDVGYTSFVTNSNGLIVAGGGGGGADGFQVIRSGGYGGGTNGGNGSKYGSGRAGTGGTQSAAGGEGYCVGGFGYGGNVYINDSTTFRRCGGGGGGGFYGGGGGEAQGYGADGTGCAGGGGSGWIGGVPETTYKGTTYTPSMTDGANSGNGKAKVTRIA